MWHYFSFDPPENLKNNLSSVARALWTGLAANAIKPPDAFSFAVNLVTVRFFAN